jgi:hypothetical protein
MTQKQKYKKIKSKKNYNLLLKSGMFWEIFPELSGNYEEDKKIIIGNKNDKINN